MGTLGGVRKCRGCLGCIGAGWECRYSGDRRVSGHQGALGAPRGVRGCYGASGCQEM